MSDPRSSSFSSDPETSSSEEAEAAEVVPASSFLSEAEKHGSPSGPLSSSPESLALENAALKEKFLRTLAEMENLRRRTEKEVSDAKLYGVTSFARDMLGFADNLHRALESVTPKIREEASDDFKTFIEGIELTERDFLSRLARHGIKKIDPLGQKFDAHSHEALFELSHSEFEAGTIAQVVEFGYQIGDRILRPAKVGVARGQITKKQEAS